MNRKKKEKGERQKKRKNVKKERKSKKKMKVRDYGTKDFITYKKKMRAKRKK